MGYTHTPIHVPYKMGEKKDIGSTPWKILRYVGVLWAIGCLICGILCFVRLVQTASNNVNDYVGWCDAVETDRCWLGSTGNNSVITGFYAVGVIFFSIFVIMAGIQLPRNYFVDWQYIGRFASMLFVLAFFAFPSANNTSLIICSIAGFWALMCIVINFIAP